VKTSKFRKTWEIATGAKEKDGINAYLRSLIGSGDQLGIERSQKEEIRGRNSHLPHL